MRFPQDSREFHNDDGDGNGNVNENVNENVKTVIDAYQAKQQVYTGITVDLLQDDLLASGPSLLSRESTERATKSRGHRAPF